jgi:hypothetical protein
VFRSACDFIVKKNKAVIADLVMKLIEPMDICKHLTLCPPEEADLLGVGSMNGFGANRVAMTMPPQYRGAFGYKVPGGPKNIKPEAYPQVS